jgi:bifunctional UDP-N-acetylglucosamine pyrophosphorylase / glucosamine-1-phosphate N-acetyltransferase
MRRGVTMLDPASVHLDVTVALGVDVTLLPGTVLQGATSVGEGSTVGPATHLVDTTVGRDSVVRHTAADGAEIGDGTHVGPFASLGKGAVIPDGVVTGPSYTAG